MEITQDVCLYADMLQCKRSGGTVLYETEDALLLQGRVSKILYSAASSLEAGKRIIEHLPVHFDILVAHDKYTEPWLNTMRNLTCELECVHCVYTKTAPPEIQLPDGFTIQRLDTRHMQMIISLYRHCMELFMVMSCAALSVFTIRKASVCWRCIQIGEERDWQSLWSR